MRRSIAGFAEVPVALQTVVLLVVGMLSAVAAPTFFWMWNAPLVRSKFRADLDAIMR